MRQFVLNINSESIKIQFEMVLYLKNTFLLITKHAVKYLFESKSFAYL